MSDALVLGRFHVKRAVSRRRTVLVLIRSVEVTSMRLGFIVACGNGMLWPLPRGSYRSSVER